MGPEELARAFWEMDPDDHVKFFNTLSLLIGQLKQSTLIKFQVQKDMWKLHDQLKFVRGDINVVMDAFGGK